MICGLCVAAARCIGAESTVINNRARAIKAAQAAAALRARQELPLFLGFPFAATTAQPPDLSPNNPSNGMKLNAARPNGPSGPGLNTD